jgi:hypothetical protein
MAETNLGKCHEINDLLYISCFVVVSSARRDTKREML